MGAFGYNIEDKRWESRRVSQQRVPDASARDVNCFSFRKRDLKV